MAAATREMLLKLHELVLRERECAKALQMEEMLAATREKEELLQSLGEAQELSAADRELASLIRHENRRNAYLFWATLKSVRETMEFFGRQSVPAAYGAGGAEVRSQGGGRLLSGRI